MPFKREVVVEERLRADDGTILATELQPFRMETKEQLVNELEYLAGLMADNPDHIVAMTITITWED